VFEQKSGRGGWEGKLKKHALNADWEESEGSFYSIKKAS